MTQRLRFGIFMAPFHKPGIHPTLALESDLELIRWLDRCGFDGVIDKDRCSATLATALDADMLVLLTGVRRVALDFGTRWERWLERITVSDAVRGLADGEFPAGSMGPKIESAARFIEGADGQAVITAVDHLTDAVEGHDGTRVVADEDGPSRVAQAVPIAGAA